MYTFMEPKFKEHFKKFRISKGDVNLAFFKKIFRENLNVLFLFVLFKFCAMFPNFFSWTFAHSDMLSLVHQCMFCKIDIITVFNLIWNSGIFSLLLSTGNTFESTAL